MVTRMINNLESVTEELREHFSKEHAGMLEMIVIECK